MIQSALPAEFRAGDTLTASRAWSAYPASAGWVLAFTFVGLSSYYVATAATDGDSFALNVPAATTVTWTPGSYSVVEYVSNAGTGERFTLTENSVRILPNLAAATGGVDTRTHARKVLDSIEAWLESKAPTAAAVEVGGRKLQRYSLPDLLVLRDRYRVEVMREERAARGLGAVTVVTRF